MHHPNIKIFASILTVLGLLLIIAITNAQPRPIHARTADLLATHDTLVDPNNPATNYNGTRLEVTYTNFPSFAPTRRTLLQFNLSGITTALSSAPVAVQVVENNIISGANVNLSLYALADNWDEATVTYASQPALGDLLQTVNIATGFTGPVQFNAATVGAYLETQRNGDGIASFQLRLDSGAGNLGFAGSILFEDHEGTHDGVNGNEPLIVIQTEATATPTATMTDTPIPLPTTATPTMTDMPLPLTATATATMTDTPIPLTGTATPTSTPVATPAQSTVFIPLVSR